LLIHSVALRAGDQSILCISSGSHRVLCAHWGVVPLHVTAVTGVNSVMLFNRECELPYLYEIWLLFFGVAVVLV